MERIEVINKTAFSYVGRIPLLAVGYIINGELHVLRRSNSRDGLIINSDLVGQYYYQDECCDRGLSPTVLYLIEKAAKKGVTAFVLWTGHWRYRVPRIVGLPVRNVEDYYGRELPEGAKVINLRHY